MSAELATANQVKSYGMRLLEDTDFDVESMIDVTSDVTNSTMSDTTLVDDIFAGSPAIVETFTFNDTPNSISGNITPPYNGIYAPAIYNNGASFNNATNENIVISTNGTGIVLDNNLPVTFSFSLSLGTEFDREKPFAVWWNGDTLVEFNGNKLITLWGQTGAATFSYGSGADFIVDLTVDVIHHFIVEYNPGNPPKLYINALLQNPNTSNTTYTYGPSLIDTIGGQGGDVITAVLDQVRIFNDVLNQSQIDQLANELVIARDTNIPDNSKIVIPYYKYI